MIKKILGGVVILVLGFYAAATSYMYANQADLIFAKRLVDDDYDWGFDPDVEVVSLDRPTATLKAAYHPGPTPGDAIVLFFHGNGQNLSASVRMAEMFEKLGYDLFAVERRETGQSHGELREDAMIEDALVWYDYTRERWPEADIRVVGYSMGTAWSTALAAMRPQVKDVVLFAPFNSLIYMAKYRNWYMPDFLLDAVMAFPLRSDLHVAQANQARFRIYHGTDDPVVPYESGAALQNRFNGDDSFITVEGADHWQVIWNDQTFADLKASWGRPVASLETAR